MQFKAVLGQEQVKSKLIASVKEDRISHAQLFFGPEGSGKLPLAIAYAQYICCTDRREDDSCGVCPSCLKIEKLAHPDIHFVYPVVKSKQSVKSTVSDEYLPQWRETIGSNPYISENQWYEAINAENKQGLISREESKEVIRKLSLKSYESEFKVMILWLAEKMHRSAASSLLKILEEPPQKTVFLLISENTNQILPTILSRTQMIRIQPLKEEEISVGLATRYPENELLVKDVLRRSHGNFSTAIRLIESGEQEEEYFEEFVYFMRKCYGREIIDLQKWTDKIAGWGRERLKHFLNYALRMIRENFMLHLEQQEITYLTRKELEFSERFSPFIHQGNVYSMAEEFTSAIDHIGANGQAKIILLDLAIKNILLLKQKETAL